MENAIRAQARTTDVIAAEIVVIRDQTKRLVLAASVEIGRRLCEAKELLHHGEWGKWLEEKVEYSQSTAGNLMRIYREYGDEQVKISENRSIASVTGAVRILKISFICAASFSLYCHYTVSG